MGALLNSPQREAIKYLDGPCLVLAGAGSGKTRVITEKIAYLLQVCEFVPSSIAAITFTNKAAKEMQERVSHLLQGKLPKGLTICTFHALGVHFIRMESHACGLKSKFSILDTTDTRNLLEDICPENDKPLVKQIQWQISSWKNDLISPQKATQHMNDALMKSAAPIYAEYQRTLRAYHAVDFDDLIYLPVTVLQEDEHVRQRWQQKLRYLLIDEYQDTNLSQYILVRLLSGERSAFTAVGDDDQSIYGWRGARVENLNLLQQDYSLLKVIKLEQNYRSTVRILQAANALISNNKKLFEKRLWSEHGLGTPIQVNRCKDAEYEAQWVVKNILAHRFEHHGQFKEYAILYRSNHQARVFEKQLRAHKVPYTMSGGQSFFEKTEIRDIIAYLKLLSNPEDDLAFIRAITVPRKGVGRGSLEAMGHFAAQHKMSLWLASQSVGFEHCLTGKARHAVEEFSRFIERFQSFEQSLPVYELLVKLLDAIQYKQWLFSQFDEKDAENRWRSLSEFISWLGDKGKEEGKSLSDLTQTLALMSMLNKEDPDFDGVQLATLHAAKGLEFNYVFLVGVEEGILPHQNSIEAQTIEEERRLMYVGITRAKRELRISWCEKRTSAQEIRHCEESRFIAEMGNEIERKDKTKAEPLNAEERKARLAKLMALMEQH